MYDDTHFGIEHVCRSRANRGFSLLLNRLSLRLEKIAQKFDNIPPSAYVAIDYDSPVEFPAFDICKAIFRRAQNRLSTRGSRNYRKSSQIFPPISCALSILSLGESSRVRLTKEEISEWDMRSFV